MITDDDIQGHWVREWIKAPGFEDHTTAVHWIQVGADYADIRVPLDRPDLDGANCLAELPAASLSMLAAAEGFAGHTVLEGSRCTWHREINWHGAPEGADIGALSFDSSGSMIEEGVEAEYTELWHPRKTAPGQAVRVAGAGYVGFLLTRGTAFVLGIGRPNAPPMQSVRDELCMGHIPDSTAHLFDGLHAYGHWTGTEAIARLATQPFSEGRIVARRSGTGLIWNAIGFDGSEREIVLSAQEMVDDISL